MCQNLLVVYWTQHQYIVTACSGDLEGAFDVFLSLDLAEIRGGEQRLELCASSLVGLDAAAAGEMLVKIRKRFDGDDLQVRDQGRFGRVHFGNEHALEAVEAGSGCHRQHPARMAHHSIQRELADHDRAFDAVLWKKACQDDDPQRDRQVVSRTFLTDRGRRQIDHHPVTREIQTRVLDRGLHSLAAFLNRGIRQTHDDHGRQPVGVVHLHFDDDAFETDDSTGVDARKHAGESRRGQKKCQSNAAIICPFYIISFNSVNCLFQNPTKDIILNFIPTSLPGVLLVEPKVFQDERGFFLESYQKKKFTEAGIPFDFVQDNHSKSCQGVLRGLHYQIKQPQGKLLRVASGEIFDVAVDIRRSSPTFGKWFGTYLSAENKRMLWVPVGFAHGFYVTSPEAELLYKATDYYAPEWERSILWNDPALDIQWPLVGESPSLSARDKAGSLLSQAEIFEAL